MSRNVFQLTHVTTILSAFHSLVQTQSSIRYHFRLSWGTSFNISYGQDCWQWIGSALIWRVFIPLSFWRIFLLNIKFQVDSFSFQCLQLPLTSCLHLHDKRSATLPWLFSLSLVFSSVVMLCLGVVFLFVVFYMYSAVRSMSLLDQWTYRFHDI